jgi:AraC-like DNA-binding protein
VLPRRRPRDIRISPARRRIVNMVDEYLMANTSRPIYTEDLCDVLNVSTARLAEALRASFGVTRTASLSCAVWRWCAPLSAGGTQRRSRWFEASRLILAFGIMARSPVTTARCMASRHAKPSHMRAACSPLLRA